MLQKYLTDGAVVNPRRVQTELDLPDKKVEPFAWPRSPYWIVPPQFAHKSCFLAIFVLACGSQGADRGGQTSAGGGAGVGGRASANGGGAANGGRAGGSSGGASVGLGGATVGGNAGQSGALGCVDPLVPDTNADDPVSAPSADPALAGATHRFFKITCKDSGNGHALAGVTLTTVNQIQWVSDDNGVIAFYEPGLMGTSVFFTPTRDGYTFPADGLGIRGKALTVTEGASAELLLDPSGSSGAITPQGDLATRLAAGNVPGAAQCSAVFVSDSVSHRAVPLVRLSAFGEDYWTDSLGMIAYCNPDHLGGSVTFSVFSHGYALSGGQSAVALDVKAGGSASVSVVRGQVGERLYRIIGEGIDRDSVLLGLQTPLAHPTINAQLFGSDTAGTTVHNGKVFWIWQDTEHSSYALGNFHGTAATSDRPASGGLSANRGADLAYFTGSDGFVSHQCDDCDSGSHPVWMGGLSSVADQNGATHLFSGYAVVDGTGASVEEGLAQFDDSAHVFKRVLKDFLTRSDFARPDGHAFDFSHDTKPYRYYRGRLRIPARAESFLDPTQYEQFTPYPASGNAFAKRADGTLDYEWRAGGRHVTSDALKSAGISTDQDLDGHDTDAATGNALALVAPSITWNPYRRRFVQITQQQFGASSFLGEIWQSEADTPAGPFIYAAKIITHDKYTFYNVLQHPEFDHGQFAYVEGTYTASYSGAAVLTPRYDYNQQLYRVDLEAPALDLPVAIYDLGAMLPGSFGNKFELAPTAAPAMPVFYAPDRARADLVAVSWSDAACASSRHLVVSNDTKTAPLFFALPASTANPPAHTVALYEYTNAAGATAYGLATATMPAGFTRSAKPIALVWENPVKVALPVASYLGDLRAAAGADQCVTAAAGRAKVHLDASSSTANSGTIRRYVWHIPDASGCAYLEGAQIDVQLPPGIHRVDLEIEDDSGHRASDTLIVQVT